MSMTNGLEVMGFIQKVSEYLLWERKTKLYSAFNNDSKAVSIEGFNRTLLYIINKLMFINGDCFG